MNSTRSPSWSSNGSGVAARAGRQVAMSSANLVNKRMRLKQPGARIAPSPPECCRHLAGRFCQRDAGYVLRSRTKNGPGARDLSRRNAGTADSHRVISRPLRQPTFLRTKVRAPFARAATTPNRYDAGSTLSGRRCVRPNLKPRRQVKPLRAWTTLAGSDPSLIALDFIVLARP